MTEYQLKYKPFGARSVLIEWPQKITENILFDVLCFKKTLQKQYIKENVEIKSAYCSILISYDSTINNIYNKLSMLRSLYSTRIELDSSSFKSWKIPVCYDLEYGLDLNEISIKKELSISEIIEYHSRVIYTVYFIGFLPGFLYLGNLDERLHFPRKERPRMKIKKGAIGIGGMQTGVYPIESPGGWNIIGNSPIDFFDINQSKPCFAQAGDKIQFCPVSMDEYELIKDQLKSGTYQIESEVLND